MFSSFNIIYVHQLQLTYNLLSKMRKGIILSYNPKIKVGLISDENGEKVKFYNEHNIYIQNGRYIEFKIIFTKQGLMAVYLNH